MNREIKSILDKYNIPISKFTIKSGATIVDDKLVIKNKEKDDIDKYYNYLSSRSFDYFPNIIDKNDKYEVYSYVRDSYEPREQKAMDLMHLLSLLHSKTTFYREVDVDNNKKIYEDLIEK